MGTQRAKLPTGHSKQVLANRPTRKAPSRRLRWALAILLGIPGTVLFFPLTALVAYAGMSSLFDALSQGGSALVLTPQVRLGIINTVWGLAGVLGLCGFWLWVIEPRCLNARSGRLLVSILVAAGVAAMAPVAVTLLKDPRQASYWLVLPILGIGAGVLVLYQMLSTARAP